jgi:hypothetical protein
MSSRYALDGLGYSYNTMVFTMSDKGLYRSKSLKITEVRIEV